jgi:hypothetical protein
VKDLFSKAAKPAAQGMTSEQAREFSRSLTLYETRLRVTTPEGTVVEGVVVEMGLMGVRDAGARTVDHEGVAIESAGWFSLRTNRVELVG